MRETIALVDPWPALRPEATELGQAAFAQEKIPQALIADLSWTDPRFIDHLPERFGEPMHMARHEHDARETYDKADAFIHAAMLPKEARPLQSMELDMTHDHKSWPPKRAARSGASKVSASVGHGIEVFKKNGIWKVTLDGKFHGDYHQEEHALAAAALLDRPRR